jgi:hypothetical protein
MIRVNYEDFYQKAQHLHKADFKQIIGIKKAIFSKMERVLTVAFLAKHAKGGRPSKMPVGVQLLMTLKYWRHYVTQKELAFEFEVGEATIHDTIVWIENTLIKSGKFKIPGKKALLKDSEIEVVLVDVTESPIERPKKKQRIWYSGKKKCHTIKTQVIIEQKTGKIFAVDHGKGSIHDFKLYKKTVGYAILNDIFAYFDSGYQGVLSFHKNSEIPKKKSKKHPLTKEEKANNCRISRQGVLIEHVNAKLKVFKILANKYRNRRKRFGIRFNLISALLNWEIFC